MLIQIHPDNPDQRKIKQVLEILRKGGVIIFPTDSVYAIGADISQHKALERVAKLKGIKLEQANFSIVCHDLSHLSDFSRQIDTPTFKVLKRAFPGPYTFILPASNQVPKMFNSKKKTIGIRVPDNKIAQTLVRELGSPLVATSVHDEDEIIEYTTDPELIHERYENLVDVVIDGGFGDNIGSTVIDCTNGMEIVREGKGSSDIIY